MTEEDVDYFVKCMDKGLSLPNVALSSHWKKLNHQTLALECHPILAALLGYLEDIHNIPMLLVVWDKHSIKRNLLTLFKLSNYFVAGFIHGFNGLSQKRKYITEDHKLGYVCGHNQRVKWITT
jgi:hypothetical protein